MKERISLIFFSTDASKWEDVYTAQIQKDIFKFCVFGNFDIFLLAFNKSIEKLQEIQEKFRSFGLTQDYRYHFGTLYYPQESELSKIWNDLPLLVVSSIKFKKEIWGSLKDNININDVCKWLKGKVEYTIESISAKEDVKFAVIISYGWEDFILIFFSNSYKTIKRIICKLRTLKFDDIKELAEKSPDYHYRHLIATTCSLSAAWFDYGLAAIDDKSKISRNNAKKVLLSRIKDEDGTLASTMFQIRPGHMDWLRRRFLRKQIKVTFGRTDLLILSPKEKLSSFFTLFFNVILPLLEKQDSPITSTETSFSFNFDDNIKLDENIGSEWRREYQKREYQRKEKEEKLKEELKVLKPYFLNIPEHTVKAIVNLIHTGQHLRWDYELINDSFVSLFALIDTIKISLRGIAKNGKLKYEKDFWDKITSWLKEFDLCFKDRFRGVYPTGETSTMPLITYQGSFHKFLTIVDAIAGWTFDIARRRIKKNGFDIPLFALCSHIGNPPSPNIMVTPTLYSGFINVPVDLMFFPERLFYIFHETGHAFFRGVEIYGEIDLKGERLFDDILADYFCGVIGFGGENWKDCKRLFMEYDNYISPYKNASEIEGRLFLAEAIYKHVKGETSLEKPKVRNDLLKLDSLRNLAQNKKNDFLNALSQFIELLKNDKFKKLLCSLQDTSTPYDSKKEAILQDIISFFKKDKISDEDRHQFFHSIWLKIHREISKEYFLS